METLSARWLFGYPIEPVVSVLSDSRDASVAASAALWKSSVFPWAQAFFFRDSRNMIAYKENVFLASHDQVRSLNGSRGIGEKR